MKKLTVFLLVLMTGTLLSSCFSLINAIAFPPGKFKNEFDEFTKKSISSFEVEILAEERFAPIHRAGFHLLNDGSNEKLYVTLHKNPSAFYPEKKLYIKTDREVIVLPFKNVEEAHFTTQHSSQTVVTDSTSTKTSSSSNEVVNQVIKLVLELDERHKDLLLSAKSIAFRVYSGGKPNTFYVKEINEFKKVFDM
jgi:hypothetical protein